MPCSKKKRTAAGNGTIRKKTVMRKGKQYTYWEARYTTGYDPGTGKQIQKSVTGATQKEVAAKLRQITMELDLGTYHEKSKLTLAEWLDQWTSDYLCRLKPLSQKTYMDQVNNHIKPALGAVKLEELTTHMIQKFYNNLQNGKLAKLSAKSIKNIHGVLHKALQQAVATNQLAQNPADACCLPRVVKPEISVLEPEQIALVLKEAEKDDYHNLFLVAMFTGMRQGELLGLAWEAVDFKTGCITVKQQLQRKDGEYYLLTPKSGKPRKIFPAPVVMDALRREQQQQALRQAQAGELWNNPFHLVFTDESGKNLVRRTVVKHFKSVAARAGVSESRFHDLRHSFAVTSLQAGDDVKTVQENLGHATAAFTLDVYGHVTAKMKQESAARMQKFYENLSA
jgi:integrase